MNKKAYHKEIGIVFLIIIVSAVLMYTGGRTGDNATAFVVAEEQEDEYEERPIQDVVKDLENAGFERVANDPTLR